MHQIFVINRMCDGTEHFFFWTHNSQDHKNQRRKYSFCVCVCVCVCMWTLKCQKNNIKVTVKTLRQHGLTTWIVEVWAANLYTNHCNLLFGSSTLPALRTNHVRTSEECPLGLSEMWHVRRSRPQFKVIQPTNTQNYIFRFNECYGWKT